MPEQKATLLVVLARHAEREYYVSLQDWQQPITPKGQRAANNLGERLRSQLFPKTKSGEDKISPVRLIFSSPFLRCKQTAAILMDYLEPKAGVHPVNALSLTTDEKALEAVRWTLKTVAANLETGCLVFVGHQPELTAISRSLCGRGIELKKAEAIGLEIEIHNGMWIVGSASLIWKIKG